MSMTKNEAIEKMIKEFNAIPHEIIENIKKNDWDSVEEITYCNISNECSNFEKNECENELDNKDDIHLCKYCEIYDEYYEIYGSLPMWGWLWETDGYVNKNNIKEVSECGFRIYEVEGFQNILIGIDGAGYDFYDDHWLPLYNILGLQWHDSPYKYNCYVSDENGNRIYYEEE